MNKKTSIAILDLGSEKIKGVLSSFSADGNIQQLITAQECSQGIESGFIKNKRMAANCISNIFSKLERKTDKNIDFTYIVLNDSYSITSVIKKDINLKRGRLIKREDIEWLTQKIIKSAEKNNPNYTIINTKLVHKYIDGLVFPFEDIENQHAKKSIAIKMCFVLSLKSYIKSIQSTMHSAKLDLDYIIPSYVAMGFFLSGEQKKTKTCVIDVGAQTTTVAIFQKGVLEKGETFNMGGTDIKESVSRTLGIDLQKAEERKKSESQMERNREIEKIVVSELKKIAASIQKYLKQYDLNKEISGGIVLSGGVSCDQSMQDAFKSVFKLPIYKVNMKISDDKSKTDRSWALLQGGISCITDEITNNTYKNSDKSKIYKWLRLFFKHIGNKLSK